MTVVAQAWKMMTRRVDPMPAIVARDWVMDQLGVERKEAVKLLIAEAADRTNREHVALLPSEYRPDDDTNTGSTAKLIRQRRWNQALWCTHWLDELSQDISYVRWRKRLVRRVKLLRELCCR